MNTGFNLVESGFNLTKSEMQGYWVENIVEVIL